MQMPLLVALSTAPTSPILAVVVGKWLKHCAARQTRRF
jgi:hypothetical protein